MGMPPFLEFEMHGLPADLRDELELIALIEPDREEGGPPCIWYDPTTNKCKHYEHRPHVCADFPVGCESCLLYRQCLSQ